MGAHKTAQQGGSNFHRTRKIIRNPHSLSRAAALYHPLPQPASLHLQTGVGCWCPTKPAGRLLQHVITPVLPASSYGLELQGGSVLFGGGLQEGTELPKSCVSSLPLLARVCAGLCSVHVLAQDLMSNLYQSVSSASHSEGLNSSKILRCTLIRVTNRLS